MTTDVFKQINAFAYQVMRQTNTRHLSWVQQFGGRLQTEITEQLGAQVPTLLAQAITQYQAAAAHEDDCYLIISKSDLTPQIAGIDDERDTKYVGLKSMADALKRIGTPEQQQIAQQLLDLCAHYKVDISERYDDETTKMSQLLQELQTETWTSRVAALGLTATVNDLVSLNQQMKHLIEMRNNEQAQVTPQAMQQARAASDEAYALVVTIINALAVTDWANGSSHYDQAIARINQDQDYYVKNVFAKGSSSSSNNNGGGSNSGGGSSDNGGDTPTPDNPDTPDTPDTPDNPTPDPDPNNNGGGDNGGGGSNGNGEQGDAE